MSPVSRNPDDEAVRNEEQDIQISHCHHSDEETSSSSPDSNKKRNDPPKAVAPASGLAKFGVAFTFALLISVGGPLTASTISKDGDDKARKGLRDISVRNALIFLPPSVLFIVVNIMRIVNLRFIDPASAELIGTLRIAFTAVMLRALLKRIFSVTQMFAIVLLSASVVLSQLDGAKVLQGVYRRGVLGSTFVAVCSAFASVYMEWALKSTGNVSMSAQSIMMYSWGVLLNAIVYYFTGGSVSFDVTKAFAAFLCYELKTGYSTLTGLLVFHLATCGLFVAWLLKYADAITKIQSTSAGLFLTSIISAACLGTVISINMIAGMILIAASLFMYHGFVPKVTWPWCFKGSLT